jgi:hypothetical protein
MDEWMAFDTFLDLIEMCVLLCRDLKFEFEASGL